MEWVTPAPRMPAEGMAGGRQDYSVAGLLLRQSGYQPLRGSGQVRLSEREAMASQAGKGVLARLELGPGTAWGAAS